MTLVPTREEAALKADTLAQFNTHKERVSAVLAAADEHDKEQGVLRITREELKEIRDQAWKQGYQACYEGRQRHSPYQPTRSD